LVEELLQQVVIDRTIVPGDIDVHPSADADDITIDALLNDEEGEAFSDVEVPHSGGGARQALGVSRSEDSWSDLGNESLSSAQE
jgi:hypothetical protein